MIKKNIKVIFNFAFFEPTEYVSLNYFLIKYNYGFDCIKLTDYELFNNEDNFVFSKIFNLFSCNNSIYFASFFHWWYAIVFM